MGAADKDRRLGQAVGDITDTLVEDFDVVEIATRVVHHCADLAEAESVGLLVTDGDGDLRLLAATSEEANVVEGFQVVDGDGPCVEAFRTGERVVAPTSRDIEERWPGFGRVARREGIRSVFAQPLRLRGAVIGSLNVFRSSEGELDADTRRRIGLLADLATVALAQAERARDSAATVRQLQGALDSRVVIEQAKGVVIAVTGADVDQAFAELRAYARTSRRRLSDVAQDVVERRLTVESMRAGRPR